MYLLPHQSVHQTFGQTCCWLDNAGGAIRKHCQTCLSDGYGGFTINCSTTIGPAAKTFGDIYKIPTRGPAVQDTPQSETNGPQQQGGVLQGDPVVGEELLHRTPHNQKLAKNDKEVS